MCHYVAYELSVGGGGGFKANVNSLSCISPMKGRPGGESGERVDTSSLLSGCIFIYLFIYLLYFVSLPGTFASSLLHRPVSQCLEATLDLSFMQCYNGDVKATWQIYLGILLKMFGTSTPPHYEVNGIL